MVEILKSFEQVAGRLSPVVLVVPGVAAAVLGLVAWLAGMCLRRVVLACFGAAVGALISLIVSGQNPAVAGAAAGGGAALGALLPRLALALLLAAVGVAITFAVLAKAPPPEQPSTLFGGLEAGQTEKYTVSLSLDVVRTYGIDMVDWVKAAGRNLIPVNWAILAAVGLGLLLLGLLFGWTAGALTCSLLGTALVFAGLTLLLLFKGSDPIGRMQQQGAYYGLVSVGLVAFGTLEQLLVCRPPKRQPGGKSQQGESKHAWRNR